MSTDAPNFAKNLASLVVSNSSEPADVAQKQFSIRVDITLFCFLEEVAKRTGLSRNAAVNQLLRSGLHSFMAELPEEVADVLRDSVELREESELHAISPDVNLEG